MHLWCTLGLCMNTSFRLPCTIMFENIVSTTTYYRERAILWGGWWRTKGRSERSRNEIEKETILHHDDTIFYPRVACTGTEKYFCLKPWILLLILFFSFRSLHNYLYVYDYLNLLFFLWCMLLFICFRISSWIVSK